VLEIDADASVFEAVKQMVEANLGDDASDLAALGHEQRSDAAITSAG
jgi:hypothetical protein